MAYDKKLVGEFLVEKKTGPHSGEYPWYYYRKKGSVALYSPQRDFHSLASQLHFAEYVSEAKYREFIKTVSLTRLNARTWGENEEERNYWVVSPNVRYNDVSVSEWRQASVIWKAAFMGYGPDIKKHKQIGYKFAKVIKPNDIILIARRSRHEPEIVGFGVVQGRFRTSLNGFNPPDEGPDVKPGFGSARMLRPFVPMSRAPKDLRIIRILGHTTALRRLYPERYRSHADVCEWMEQTLQGERGERPATTSRRSVPPRETNLPSDEELEYRVKSSKEVRIARRREANLVRHYHEWLEKQGRNLRTLTLGNLKCDAYEKARRNLIEAKASSSREHIRMAVGQLLDYAFNIEKSYGKLNLAILVPDRPEPKSVRWLSQLGIGLVWEERGSFVDDSNGQFT